MKVTTMNISLPPELARFVRDRVEGGGYASASEVVREALRLLQRAEILEDRDQDDGFDRGRVAEAIEGLRELSRTQTLGEGVSIRDLIDEGRA